MSGGFRTAKPVVQTLVLQILKLTIFQCFVCHCVAREILHRMIYDSGGSISLGRHTIIQKSEKVGFRIETHYIFGSDSANPYGIIIIFELDRDIWETSLWAKILTPSNDFWKSYCVNGRPDWPTLECTHSLSTQKSSLMNFRLILSWKYSLMSRALRWQTYFHLWLHKKRWNSRSKNIEKNNKEKDRKKLEEKILTKIDEKKWRQISK